VTACPSSAWDVLVCSRCLEKIPGKIALTLKGGNLLCDDWLAS
jgi:hypothetical protein